MPKLSQIYLYPVKSLAGIAVDSWPVDQNGLLYDRKWMLVDAQGRFLSQRTLPNMALIRPRIGQTQLSLSAPGREDLLFPLQGSGGDSLEVEIWDDRCLAESVSEAADRWFSDFLQTDCRLVFLPAHEKRPVDPRYALASDQTAFSDGFPFLLASVASLNAFNRTLEQPIAMLRFRPNLVVSDCAAYAEDSWRRIKINDIGFRLPKPCSRCPIPGIDPNTALADKTVLAALNRSRRWDNKVYFGQNALHDTVGRLAVGDSVEILETGSANPPLSRID